MIDDTLPICVQRFFTDHLAARLRVSAHTIASYRDTFRPLLDYASNRFGRCPTNMRFEDLDATLIGDFVAYLETERGNSVCSRTTRLTAIRSFFRFTAIQEPQFVHYCQRVLSIPVKKFEKRTVTYLNGADMAAPLSAPDTTTWFGRRDRTLPLQRQSR